MAKRVPQLIVNDRLLIPKKLIPKEGVEARYRIQIFDEATCHKCEVFQDGLRPNDICEECPAFVANYKLFRDVGDYWSVPQGDLLAVEKLLKRKDIDYEVIDERHEYKFRYPIKWTGKLFGANHIDENGIRRANQEEAVKKWLANEDGILVAPPRSGKTPMSAYIACKLGLRTVILAHQIEILQQFFRTFVGGHDRPAMTNIPELRKEYKGRRIIHVAQKVDDLKNLKDVDILIVNYQKMIYDLDRVFKYLNGKFSLLILDEVHNSAATSYLRVAAALNVKHRLSLSATYRRKDMRHLLLQRIMGPPVAKIESTSLVPVITYKFSQAQPPRAYKIWRHALSWLYKSKERNIEILKQAFTDLRAGHNVIIIPVDTLAHQKILVDMINEQAEINRDQRAENWPKQLAVPFNAKSDRVKTLLRVDDGKPCVFIPIRKMIKEAIDFKLPSMMYIVTPMSASKQSDIGAPAVYQLSMRVCTPVKKPQPVVRFWVDMIGMMQSCIKSTFYFEVWKKRVTEENPNGLYKVSKEEYEKIKLLNQKSTSVNHVKPSNPYGW